MIKTKKRVHNKSEREVLRNYALFALKEKRIRVIDGIDLFKSTTSKIFVKYKELFGIDVKEGYKKNKRSRGGKWGSKPVKDRIEDGFVYFIINEEYKICKIGYSVSPANRLKHLQTSSPYLLKIQKTVVGDIQMERLFHKIYKDYRLEGEWFRLEGELKTFVYSNR